MFKRYWNKLLGLFLLLYPVLGISQYYDTGQDPFNTHWQQINTPHFRFIFPQGVDSLAMIYANYLHKTFENCGKTLNCDGTKVPVILHNKSSLSNGEVAWAPKRMDLIAFAPQNNLCVPWHRHLILHESRHVMQIDKVNHGFTKGLSFLFGQQAVPAIMSLHVPFWFLEGDAVAYESGAGGGGRALVPDFTMALKAQVIDAKIYSYPKAMFGSYKHFVPNKYELGYYLVSSAREKYGTEIWSKALNNVGKYPIHWNPFSASIKKTTGLPERKLYASLLDALKQSGDTIKKKLTQSIDVPCKPENRFCSYYNPSIYKNKLVVLKTSLTRVPKFVVVENGKESTVKVPGYLSNKTFSINNNQLVWNELKLTRWANQNYSNIVRYDIENKKLKNLTHKQRIFGSKISKDGLQIVSVESNELVEWRITIRNADNGLLLQAYKMDTLQPVYPNWSPDNQEIVFVGISNFGRSLGLLNISSGKVKWILKNEKLEFSTPQHLGGSILLRATYNNATNFYKYNLQTKKWKVLTNVKYGVGEGELYGDRLVFSDYTAQGYQIKELPASSFFNREIEKPQTYYSHLANNLIQTERNINIIKIDTSFNIEKYSRFKHLFNIHSWAPLAVRIENQEVGLGATIMSQNELSTSFLSAGYQYYWAQNRDEVFVNYEYKGFYPVLSAKYSWSPYYTYDKNTKVDYFKNSLLAGTKVPVVLQKGPWTTLLSPELYYAYDAILFKPNGYTDFSMHSLKYGVYAYNRILKSKSDLYPKWGQAIYVQYQHAPFDTSGNIFAAQAWGYFPGILNNHSFRISGGVQTKESGTFTFMDKLSYPRGYLSEKNTKMITTSVNYSFPILYPDLNAFQVAYIKRLKANLFYDYANYYFNNKDIYQESLGFELTADFHALRFVAPFEMGVRYTRKISIERNFIQFMFKIDLSNLY